jgi:hypothetical protein
MTTPVDVNPGGSGACSEPCNMCCTLHKGTKSFTRLKNGSPVTVSCTKLWWNCTCNGTQKIMQRQIAGVWTDFESSWFSPTSNWWYPPPRQSAYNCRIKCVLSDGFTYYSNVVSVDAAWQCACDDGTSLRNYRIDVDGRFYYTNGGGTDFNWSASIFADVVTSAFGNGIYVNTASMASVMLGGFSVSPMPGNILSLDLTGGYLLPDFATRGAFGTWRLDLGLGNPCTQIAPCASGAMTFCSSCPLVTSNQNYWAHGGGLYIGYSQISSVNAVLITCT